MVFGPVQMETQAKGQEHCQVGSSGKRDNPTTETEAFVNNAVVAMDGRVYSNCHHEPIRAFLKRYSTKPAGHRTMSI